MSKPPNFPASPICYYDHLFNYILFSGDINPDHHGDGYHSAPFLAVLEVIIYAGAIMVLFLFVVIMMKADTGDVRLFDLRQWLPVAIFGLVYMVIGMGIITTDPNSRIILKTARAAPSGFGQFIFENHWHSIEIVSLLLLVVLAGALILGRRSRRSSAAETTKGEL